VEVQFAKMTEDRPLLYKMKQKIYLRIRMDNWQLL